MNKRSDYNSDDGFKLPEPPDPDIHPVKDSFTNTRRLPDENYFHDGKIENTTDLVSEGSELDLHPVEDFSAYELNSLEKKIAETELKDYDMYLKNIHSSFKHVNSINSLIKLVGTGMAVHRQRRTTIEKLKSEGNKEGTFSLDANGNIITPKKS